MGPVPPPPMAATPGVLQEIGFDQKLGDAVPLDLVFQDETGKDVRLGDYFGKKPVVLSLVYYDCPMLCTLSLNGLAGALEVLSFVPGQEFEVLTVSFDPQEGPVLAAAKKKAYMTRYKRPRGRPGLALPDRLEGVGRPRSRRRWASATCGTRRRSSSPTPRASWWPPPRGRSPHYLFGVEYSPKDLRLALVDAAGGKIGNAVDQVLLYCYQYNPQTGRYSASILNLVRRGGILTVARPRRLHPDRDPRRRGRPSARRPPGRTTEAHEPRIPLFPERASSIAGEVDALFLFILAITALFAVGVSIALLYFAIRYRRRSDDDRPAEIHGSLAARAHLDRHPARHRGGHVRLGGEGLLPHEPAARRRDDGERRGQALDVEAPAPDRAARDQRAARAAAAAR